MDFTKQFQGIATTSQHAATLLRKVMVSDKKDKKLFSPEQLTKVLSLLMGSPPYILFRPKSETKDYVLLLFWATSQDDSNCAQQKSVQNIKQEILSDGFQLQFTVKNGPMTSSIISSSQLLVSENVKRRYLPSAAR